MTSVVSLFKCGRLNVQGALHKIDKIDSDICRQITFYMASVGQ
jgi:hypothetical protein